MLHADHGQTRIRRPRNGPTCLTHGHLLRRDLHQFSASQFELTVEQILLHCVPWTNSRVISFVVTSSSEH